MNAVKRSFSKLISPDFLLGKTLIAIQTWLEVWVLLVKSPSLQTLRLCTKILQIKPVYTMLTTRHLVHLYNCVQQLNIQNIKGDIVECGVWNGGSAALMSVAHLKSINQVKRHIWMFDSFEGLPPPGDKDVDGKRYYFTGWCTGEIAKVEEVFAHFEIPGEIFHIIPGWFQDTLGQAPIEEIALLHVDADWYDSVSLVLEQFYDKVAPGGLIVFDDYGYWEGCQAAVKDFFSKRYLEPTVTSISSTGVYIQK